MNTGLRVNRSNIGRGLRKWYIDRFARTHPPVKFRGDNLGFPGADIFQLDMSCRAYRGTGPTGSAYLRMKVKRCVYLQIHATPCKANRTNPHALLTHPGAKSTQDTIIGLRPKAWLLYAIFSSQLLEYLHIRTARQQQLQDHPPTSDDPFAVSPHIHVSPDRIIARRNKPGSPSIINLYGAQPAGPCRTQGPVVTQRRDINIVLPSDFQDCLAFLGHNLSAVEFESYHLEVSLLVNAKSSFVCSLAPKLPFSLCSILIA
jgi:hypothetical protein